MKLSNQLDRIADNLERLLSEDRPYSDTSVAKAENDREAEFAPFGYQRPAVEAMTRIRQAMGFAHDHTVATAVILRTPSAIFSMLTVIRTLLVGASQAYYLTDPAIDFKERLRRNANLQLAQLAEAMNLAGAGTTLYDQYDALRRSVIRDAKRFGFHTTAPEPKKAATYVPPDNWWIGTRPPTEMALLDGPLDAGPDRQFGREIYRVLSATSHAQAHSVMLQVMRESIGEPDGSGFQTVAIGLTSQQTFLWLIGVGVALNASVCRVGGFLGWDLTHWVNEVPAILRHWNRLLQSLPSDAADERPGR